MTELIMLVAAMAAVTYLPRLAPLTFLRNQNIPPLLRRFFRYVPYAALGALTFPGIITSAGADHIPAALAGTATAVLTAWLSGNVMLTLAAGIGGVYLFGWLL